MRKTKEGYELFNYGGTKNNSSINKKQLELFMKANDNVPLVLHCIFKEE